MNVLRGQLFPLLKRLLVLFLIYFLLRLIFLFIYFPSFRFSGFTDWLMAFITSLRFDTAAIILSNAPFIILSLLPFSFYYHKIYQLILLVVFTTLNTFFVFANCVDLVFFRFVRKRMTADIFSFLSVGDDTKNVFPSLLRDYWYVIVICLLLTAIMIWLYRKVPVPVSNKPAGTGSRIYYAVTGLLVLIISTGAGIVGARGGIQLKPLRMIAAARSTAAENIPLVASTTFSMLSTWGKEKVETVSYLPMNEALNYYSSLHQYPKIEKSERLNVVLIILESFSKEYIGYYNSDKRFTPFFDSLISVSRSYPFTFANSKKSIEGVPAIIASLPALMEEPYITSPFSGGTINSLASVLKQEGYATAFFHGGNNGTMNFDNFSFAAGFQSYFGRNEYGPDDYDGHWGVYDHKFYRFFADKLKGMTQPFFATLFTISSHHPFDVPKELAGKFPKGDHPILESIAYADYSLRTFFEYAQQQTWFGNTLFVITADHTGPSLNPRYETRKGIYEIPLLFFRPGFISPAEDTSVAQQCDVMPSVLAYLGISRPFIAFGNNLFDSRSHRFSISYLQDSYQLISNEWLVQFDGTNLLNAYRWRTDDLLRINLLDNNLHSLNHEVKMLQAIIQQFNFRLLNNQLSVSDR